MIKQYRKKPVVIDAVLFTGYNFTEVYEFMGEKKPEYTGNAQPDVSVVIHTLEGDMQLSAGDYLIKGVKGEFYPCKPDIFEATYEEEPMGVPE